VLKQSKANLVSSTVGPDDKGKVRENS
jgi:hypothetical protein